MFWNKIDNDNTDFPLRYSWQEFLSRGRSTAHLEKSWIKETFQLISKFLDSFVMSHEISSFCVCIVYGDYSPLTSTGIVSSTESGSDLALRHPL